MRALISEFCEAPLQDSPMPGYMYRNENTGQTVDCGGKPNRRFERLANWHRVADAQTGSGPEPEPEAPSAPGPSASAPEPPAPAPAVPERPTTRDSKAVWLEYARSVARDSDEEARASSMTKQELIDAYGER